MYFAFIPPLTGRNASLNVFVLHVADSEFIPPGSRPLTSWGQRACVSAAPRLAWEKSPPARTAGVQRGWRGGWRKAAQASPVTAGSQTKIKVIVLKLNLTRFVIFSVFSVEICMCCIFHLSAVFCISLSVCCFCLCQWICYSCMQNSGK